MRNQTYFYQEQALTVLLVPPDKTNRIRSDQTSLILPLSKAVRVYNIVLVTNKTAPITTEPTDIITRLVDTYPFLENKSSAVFANTAATIKRATPGIPYDARGWRNEMNCIRVNTKPAPCKAGF